MLTNQTVLDFTGTLASAAPAPGGGSASALMGALGAALATMVAALTIGNSDYAAEQAKIKPVAAAAEGLRAEFLALVDADTEAFNQVAAAYALPKGSDPERLARSLAIQAALAECVKTPLRMMRASVQALQLVNQALTGYNKSAASDLGVAALALGAAVRGAWLNILINLASIKDADFAQSSHSEAEALLAEALTLSTAAYDTIQETLLPAAAQ